MDAQEIFFQDQIQKIQQAIAAKEDNFEKLQQTKREKVKQSCGDSSEEENDKHRYDALVQACLSLFSILSFFKFCCYLHNTQLSGQ